MRHKKHLIYRLANGKTISVPKTGSDYRGTLNAISDLKRLMGMMGETLGAASATSR